MTTRINHAQLLVAHAFAFALRHRWAYHVTVADAAELPAFGPVETVQRRTATP